MSRPILSLLAVLLMVLPRRLRFPALTLALLHTLAQGASAAAAPEVQWKQTYESPGHWNDYPAAVAVDAAGDVIVTGQTGLSELRSHAWTAKYAGKTGALLWERISPGPTGYQQTCSALALTLDAAGDVYVTGICMSVTADQRAWVFKLSGATGEPVWERRSTRGLVGKGIKLTAAGEVIVGGEAVNTSNFTLDYYAAKFPAAGGAPVWEKTYNRRENDAEVNTANDAFKDMALDAAGNIVIAGDSRDAQTDYQTVKFAGADGSVLWARVFQNEISSGSAVPTAVAVDGNGDVITTGMADDDGTGSDFYTIKYGGGNGGVLWEKRHTRAEDTRDVPLAMVLDGAGNVILTGFTEPEGSGGDHAYAVKHAAADGAVMWTAHSLMSDTLVQEAVLDANGDVLMGGRRISALNGLDLYCAKLSGASGAFQWETTWDGGEIADESAGSMALMPDGHPVIAVVDHRWMNDNILTMRFGQPPPQVAALPAEPVTAAGATLRGTVHPHGAAVTVQFEYGPTTAYGSTATVILTNPAGTTAQDVSLPIIGYSPGALVHWRLTATHTGGDGATAVTADQAVRTLTILQDWRRQQFGEPENTGPAADWADADYDGAPNLIEWACGTEPLRFNAAPPLTVTVEIGGQSLVVTWSRSSAAAAAIASVPGAAIGVEWSQSLSGSAAWSSAGITEQVTGEAGGIQTVRTVVPVPPAAPAPGAGAGVARMFVRLRVGNVW